MVRGMLLLRNAVLGATDGRYEGAREYAEMEITAVDKDSTGGTISGRGVIDGAGEDIVPMRGVTNTQNGDTILISYPKNNPSGQKRYEYHIRSANPAPQIIVDASLPDPQFATVPYTSAIIGSPGSILANMVVFFNAVEARYFPEGYTASFKIAGGEWRESGFAPHLGGAQQILLGNDFTPGVSVQVRLRAHYSRSAVVSPGLDTRVFLAASDNITPGSATGLTVETNIPGGLKINPTGVLDVAYFDHWRYYIATSSGGAGLQTLDGPAGFVYAGSPGNRYIAVAPISKSGVVGTRFPAVAGTYSGPFAIADYAPPLDTTPPPQWAAPTLATTINQPATGGEEYWLTATLNTNANYPNAATPQTAVPDYAYTLIRISGTGFYREETLVPGQTFARVPVIAGVLLSVTAQGVDKLGNSGVASTAATVTITATGAPTGTPTVTTATKGAAVYISWTAVANATNYEIQRATDNLGAGAVTFDTTDALMKIDLLQSSTEITPTYWYHVRAKNLQGNGPYSGWVSGTMGKVDGQNLRANSITANEVVGDQAFFNKVTTGNLLATNLRTATSGARVEINGPGSSIELFNATDKQVGIYTTGFAIWKTTGVARAWFEATGSYFYQDSGTLRAKFDGGGVTVYRDDGTTPRSRFDVDGMLLYKDDGTQGMRAGSSGVGGISLQVDDVLQAHNGTTKEFNVWLYLMNGMRLELAAGGAGFLLQQNSSVELGFTPSTTNMGVNFGSAYGYYGGILTAGNAGTSGYANGGTLQNKAATGLASASGSAAYSREQWTQSNNGIGNKLSVLEYWVNRATNTAWGDAVLRYESRVDNAGATGGHLDIGMAASAGYWALGRSGVQDILWDQANGRITIPGTLSKGAGTFTIPHPDPAKNETHHLQHSFVESPTAGDNLYRFAVYVAADQLERAIVTELPDYWHWLNENGQCWISPRSSFARSWGDVSSDGRRFTIAADRIGWYDVLIIGTRKDSIAVDSWAESGGIEPLRKTQEVA